MNSNAKDQIIETFKQNMHRLAELDESHALASVLEEPVVPNEVLQALREILLSDPDSVGRLSGVNFHFLPRPEVCHKASFLSWQYADILGVKIEVEQAGFAHIMRFDPEPEIDTIFN